MAERPEIFVHLLPDLIPAGALRGGVAVVLDVLRATTVMVQALASGCEAILPCLEIEDARRTARELPKGQGLLGGERQGLPIEGFDLGNSPASYTPEVCRGKTLVMTTTNGTRAILASLEAERVLIASFLNLDGTIGTLRADGRPVHVVCAGTDGLVSWEDTLLAGALASELDAHGLPTANDAGLLAARAWLQSNGLLRYGKVWAHAPRRPSEQATHLRHVLGLGRGGRRVEEIGLGADLEDAARIDGFGDLLAEVRRDPVRIVGRGPLNLF